MRLIAKAISTIRNRSKQLSARKTRKPVKTVEELLKTFQSAEFRMALLKKLYESGEIAGNSLRRWKT